jgi:hypothetical protein
MNNPVKNILTKRFRVVMMTGCFLMTLLPTVKGQEKPPRPIELKVRTEQALQFGAFTYGIGAPGTVTVLTGGGRTTTGNVVLVGLGYPSSPAWIQVKGNIGTLVTLQVNPSSISNGGYSLPLTFNQPSPVSSPGSPFILTTNNWMDVFIGGTISVGLAGANPPGAYTGTFDAVFIQN